MGLGTYIIRRLILFIPVLLGVTILIFGVLQLFTIEQRASLYIRSPRELTPENIDRIVALHHLDDPVYIQYFHWIGEVLRGDLGFSQSAVVPVTVGIFSSLPATIELVMFAIPSTVLLGIYLGVKSAVNRDKLVDHVTRIVSIIGWSLPTFWLGLILVAIFYGSLGWVSTGRLEHEALMYATSSKFTKYTGMYTIDGILNGQLWITLDALKHLILPVITLTIVQVALIIRVMRSSMLEALSKGYVVMAKAKGLADKEVINKHARRNALIPIVTLTGILAAGLLSGVVITETVFDYKGLGYFAAHASLQLDISAVLGFALFAGFMFASANLIVDILYAYIDPRIRLA